MQTREDDRKWYLSRGVNFKYSRAVKIDLIVRLRCRFSFSECFIFRSRATRSIIYVCRHLIFSISGVAPSWHRRLIADERANEQACGIRFVFAAARVFSFVIRGFLHYHEFVRQGTRTRYETDGCPLSFARLD